MKNTIFILVTLLVQTSGIFAQKGLQPNERIDTLFSKYNSKTPGVAVVVVKEGEIVFKKGYGMANLEYDIPISSETVFHIASVSKQFTAFSIYLLRDKGLISLEDDVRKYIPELPDYGSTINIQHLLSHTSGLRDQWALLTLAGWSLEDVITTDQVLKLAVNQKKLNFEPGSEFSYCNTSYTLLAEIVRRTTGQSFSEFTTKNIFEPLGMRNTQFYDDYHKIVKNRAYSYEWKTGGYVKKKLNYSNVGPTSLFSTVEDLVKWANNFQKPIVGSEKLMREFNEISKLSNGEDVVFRVINSDTLYHAKGQIKRNYRGVDIYKHGGHDAGFRAFLARFPDEELSIITLSNDEHYEIFASGLQMAEFYLEGKMEKTDLSNRNVVKRNDTPKSFDLDLDYFTGTYHSDELSTSYRLFTEGNKLIIKHKRLPNMELTRVGENKFTGNNYFNFEMEFISDAEGSVNGFRISNFGVKELTFEKEPSGYGL